nr:hypothetical protein [Oceanibacterium hippocampi]
MLDETVDPGKSDSRTLADVLCGKEGFEHMLQRVIRNADPGIAERKLNIINWVIDSQLRRFRDRERAVARPEPQTAVPDRQALSHARDGFGEDRFEGIVERFRHGGV